MTKIAAIAPALAGLSMPAAMGIGLGLTGASLALDGYGQRQHQKRQDAANQEWMNFQELHSNKFENLDRENRERAVNELNANLEAGTGDELTDTISSEAERLGDEWTSTVPTAQDVLTSGQTGTSQEFDAAAAGTVAEATAEARKRIQAMAQATAYGGGSMGSRGMNEALNYADTAGAIGNINDTRRGDTNILRRYQQVQPEILEYERSPIVPILGTAGSLFMSGGAQGLGEMLQGGAAAAGAAAGSPIMAATQSGSGLASTLAGGGGGGVAPLFTATGGANPFGRMPFIPMAPTGSLY